MPRQSSRPPAPPDATPASDRSDLVLLGVFGAAHGVRGEVRLKSYTADPAAIASYGPLTNEAGRVFELLAVRPLRDDMLVARVKGISDRTQAEALTNVRLYVPRARLGQAAEDEDEFFHADLIGLKAETADGAPFGIVTALLDFGAGDLLEIQPAAGGPSVLLPFTKAVVPVVDVPGGRVVVAPPAEIEGEAPPGAIEPAAPRRRGLGPLPR
jgi:16S rRNA processing protein RimM